MRYFSTVPPAMVGSEKERAEPSEGGWGTKGGLQYIEIKQLDKKKRKILTQYKVRENVTYRISPKIYV